MNVRTDLAFTDANTPPSPSDLAKLSLANIEMIVIDGSKIQQDACLDFAYSNVSAELYETWCDHCQPSIQVRRMISRKNPPPRQNNTGARLLTWWTFVTSLPLLIVGLSFAAVIGMFSFKLTMNFWANWRDPINNPEQYQKQSQPLPLEFFRDHPACRNRTEQPRDYLPPRELRPDSVIANG